MGLLNKVLDSVRVAQGLQPLSDDPQKAVNPNNLIAQPTTLMSAVKSDPSSSAFQSVYSLQATVYKAVAVISSNLASLPYQVFKKNAKGDEKVDFTSNKEFNIFKEPNPWMTQYDFWEASMSYLELTGE